MKNIPDLDPLPECGVPVICTSFRTSVSSALLWNISYILLTKLFKIFCIVFSRGGESILTDILQNLKWQLKSKVAPSKAWRHMVRRGRVPIILNFRIKYWWMVSIKPRPRKSSRYPLEKGRVGPQSRFGCLGDETKIFSVPWIELIEYILKYKYNIYSFYLIFVF